MLRVEVPGVEYVRGQLRYYVWVQQEGQGTHKLTRAYDEFLALERELEEARRWFHDKALPRCP